MQTLTTLAIVPLRANKTNLNNLGKPHSSNKMKRACASPATPHTPTDASPAETARKLVETLSNSGDPKMQNSKFLQFISKMSQGDVPTQAGPSQWASEFAQRAAPDGTWASEFAQRAASDRTWASEFAQDPSAAAQKDWATQFADGIVGADHAP